MKSKVLKLLGNSMKSKELVKELFKNKRRNSKLNGNWSVLSKDKGS